VRKTYEKGTFFKELIDTSIVAHLQASVVLIQTLFACLSAHRLKMAGNETNASLSAIMYRAERRRAKP
jgi:hypothetical protein